MSADLPVNAPFGTVLGYAPGQVPVYSSDYESASEADYPNRHAYRSYINDVFMGHKWQCVEFARRWLYLNKGYIFEDVSMAYDIFRLAEVRHVDTDQQLPLKSFRNGAGRHPEPGCLLIWNEGGDFEVTGHVAIITEVLTDRIRIAEQNNEHSVWPEGQNYSRELPACVAQDGSFWIKCSFSDESILGWLIQTDDATHAEDVSKPRTDLFRIHLLQAQAKPSQQCWLNIANEDEAAFVKMMGGHHLMSHPEDRDKYMVISATALQELKRATNELHALFMHATDYVLQHPELMKYFNLPEAIWPRIRQSWDNRRNEMITGRLDFCMTGNGIKVYEYNADSGSCHMEAGKIQDKWAEHMQVKTGSSCGDQLHQELFEAWQKISVNDVVHIMQDNDLEETYHALFMQEAMERAGITCKVLKGVKDLHWREDGAIVDADNVEVCKVWKTWAWETALDQIRQECEHDDTQLKQYQLDQQHANAPRLVDVLLRRDVIVYEPLWTLIPSNKAILAVLWQLFPGHPYLLETQFSLNEKLSQKGYAEKPIAGRCGHNISIVEQGQVLEATQGKFDKQEVIYQELCMLPTVGEFNAQLCTFTVSGSYVATCMRVDTKAVITKDSDLIPLRIVDDEHPLFRN